MSNKAELLKKIKVLADRGVDGERESAQTLLARLQELTRQCAVSLDLREQERERQAAAESAGQFKVDPETGAIIEPESEAAKE